MKVAVECPGCGAGVEVEPGGRSANLFCSRCDYPLFWVRPPRLEDDLIDLTDAVLRRRPGVSGIRTPATVPCPACAELNIVAAVLCIRCDSPMQPEPEREPVVVVEEPPLPPDPEPERWPPTWLVILAAFYAFILLAGLALWVSTR